MIFNEVMKKAIAAFSVLIKNIEIQKHSAPPIAWAKKGFDHMFSWLSAHPSENFSVQTANLSGSPVTLTFSAAEPSYSCGLAVSVSNSNNSTLSTYKFVVGFRTLNGYAKSLTIEAMPLKLNAEQVIMFVDVKDGLSHFCPAIIGREFCSLPCAYNNTVKATDSDDLQVDARLTVVIEGPSGSTVNVTPLSVYDRNAREYIKEVFK